jgi:hypothetical protein
MLLWEKKWRHRLGSENRHTPLAMAHWLRVINSPICWLLVRTGGNGSKVSLRHSTSGTQRQLHQSSNEQRVSSNKYSPLQPVLATFLDGKLPDQVFGTAEIRTRACTELMRAFARGIDCTLPCLGLAIGSPGD